MDHVLVAGVHLDRHDLARDAGRERHHARRTLRRSHRRASGVIVGVELALAPAPPARRPSGLVHLTPRDDRALQWIAEQDVVRTDVVAHLLGDGPPLTRDATRRVVDRWCRSGLVQRERLLHAAAPVCWLTDAGRRRIGAPHRSKRPTVGRLDHLHAVSLVRLGVEQRGGRAWTSERSLHRERRSADAHVADGRFVTPAGILTAVEVELTVKTALRLRGIVDDLTIDYPAVLYVVRGPSVRRAVEHAVDTLAEHQRVTVVDLGCFALDAAR